MDSGNGRMLLHISLIPEENGYGQGLADATYFQIDDVLTAPEHFITSNEICDYCENNRKELGPQIRNACLRLTNKTVIFNVLRKGNSTCFNQISSSTKAKLRIMLYPGNRGDIADLDLKETTHNMIVQFAPTNSKFITSEKHKHFPSFYQLCDSEESAIRYIEALLTDACVCHYMGISNIAQHHDQKQNISKEKVKFLFEICSSKAIPCLSAEAEKLVRHVCSRLSLNTPYISFLSIFTIAPHDIGMNDDLKENISEFFEDYIELWKCFQKWYFERHGRLFSKKEKVCNPVKTIFDRNKYQGQISPEDAAKGITEILKNHVSNQNLDNSDIYAFVVLRKMPGTYERELICNSLFAGQLHPAMWTIIPWNDMVKFEPIRDLIEYLLFMVGE